MSYLTHDTLAELVDRFMLRVGLEKRKHFARFLILAEECWQEIFQNTLWVVKSTWLPVKGGTPYNYIEVPKDCQRIFSVGDNDKCGNIQPLYYNSQINVIAKPKIKKCGCDKNCGCEGLCESANSLVASTKLQFTINGVPYYQKIWMEYCKNGDLLEYTETPTKKYNNLTGDAGDFNDDYNDDYDIASAPFSDYTIVTVKAQRKVCKLEVEECGCPKETEANNQLFMDCCGFLVDYNCSRKHKHCKEFSPDINSNHRGDIKISECGTRLYYRPSAQWKKVYDKPVPDWLLLNYQTTGVTCGAETLVPQFCRNVMYACMDCARKEYNSSFSLTEKDAANYKRIDEKNKIMAFLSPVSIEFMADVQNIQVKW